ncbi:RcnB family protein [Diaphorobacter sp. HDW4A]|uniref:RcnB family protein n=1 Tax=Diaphorobacter sp. HDW4A TaxID=2714924 RepID=UPI001F10E7A7|nr:RcnB family protein [Diaphorobacter sp. HDW4A]
MQNEQQRQVQQPGAGSHKPPPQSSGHITQKPAPKGLPHQQQQHARGAGPDQEWRQGGRLPPQYRGHQYVVNDWKHHGLKKPGHGQQWVQYGGDYMLVAVASGVIAQLILGN